MLDFTTINRTIDLPQNLNFNVGFEPTRLDDQKYAINQTTGEPIAIVGSGFRCATHSDFFDGVWTQIIENMDPEEEEDDGQFLQTGFVSINDKDVQFMRDG